MKTSPALLDKLAFDRVRDALAERAATRLGMERAHALEPFADAERAGRRLDRVDAIAQDGELPLGGIEDVRPLLADAHAGRMLEGRELISVAHTLEGAERLRRDLAERDRTVLTELARAMGSFEGWLRRVREQLDADGEVKDDATPKLREIRRRLRPLRGRIRAKMEKLLDTYADAVQDPLVTLRRDRYVIPVRASAQGRVPGIALDTSDSGRTVFLEPQSVVAMNNELALLEFEERDEVRRVLLELGRSVADHPEVAPTLDVIARLDLANATVRLAEDWKLVRAAAPAGDDGTPAASREVRLHPARHPLIEGCVPNDLVLDADHRLLVVTGPNAGGKTVLLKTLGLAVVMAQSGLPVAAGEPADPPRLPWFDGVLADIGDEQSIEASLSTYAGHLVNLGRIVREAGPDTLVLIDELGSGTDPDEGAALSQAILERVLDAGASGLVTTHLAPLKVFASDAEHVRNAAMRFDVEALRPTFELVVGQPGRSYALAIADRLGLGDDVLTRAAEVLGPEGERLERLLATLEAQRASWAERQAAAEAAEARALEEADTLRGEIDRLRGREDELMAEAAQRAERELQGAVERATRLARTARTEGGEGRSQAIQEIQALRERARRTARGERRGDGEDDGRNGGVRRTRRDRAAEAPPALRPGVPVHVAGYDAEGEIAELRGDSAMVQLGLLRVEAPLHELTPLKPKKAVGRGGSGATTFGSRAPEELNIRGERVEEGIEKVRDFVHEAHALKAASVRIVHGKGTGVLRDAVRSYLRDEKRVERFEDAVPYEGGHGVTVAHLRT